jgi:hypothetical protein
MKKIASRSLIALAGALLWTACSKTHGAETQPAAKTGSPSNTVAAATPAPAGNASEAAAEAPSENKGPQYDPANMRGGGRRYEGGLDKLESEHDLSKIHLSSQDEGADDGHDHADHADHAEPGKGEQYLPQSQAQRNKGRLAMLEGQEQVHDFGKLRQGEVGNHDFLMVSDGEEALVITGVKPSCGCTKAEVVLTADDGTEKIYTMGDPIAPGTQFRLHGQINTDGRQGNFSAQVSIYANDPRGTFNLRLTAEVEPVLAVDPSPTVFFGRLTSADAAEETVTVKSTRGEPFRLESVTDVQAKPITVEITPVNPDAEGRASEWTVHVAMAPSNETGMRHYPINLRSDLEVAHPKYPSPDGSPQYHGVMINVQAQVTGMVSSEPSFLTFGMVRPGEEVERMARIECHDDFQLTDKIEVVMEGLQGQEFPFRDAFETSVIPEDGGSKAAIKVRLKGFPEGQNGSFGGVLRILVDHPNMPEVRINFSGVCRPGLPRQQ